jgi:hypothetical protein
VPALCSIIKSTSGSGHTYNFSNNPNVKANPKVKRVGQECPTHTSNLKIKINRRINPRVNSVG